MHPGTDNVSLSDVSLTPLAAAGAKSDIISETEYWIACLVFRVCLDPALSMCSLISNIINTLVFCRMDLKDGVTATFLVLSISDGLLGFFGLIQGVFAGLLYLGPLRHKLTAITMYNLVLAGLSVLNNVSTFSTLVLAAVRCCGVALPLRVKDVMTARRQLLCILVLSLPCLIVIIYGLSFYKLALRKDPVTQTTQLITTFAPDFRQRLQVADQFRSALFFASFVIINVFMVILIVALKRSSRFVKKASPNAVDEIRKPSFAESARAMVSPTEKARRRESQVIKTVLLVSAVFTVSNLPLMVVSITRQTIPGFRHTGYLRRSFDVLFMSCMAMGFINASVNIFIYLNCNTNYRKIFENLFTSSGKNKSNGNKSA